MSIVIQGTADGKGAGVHNVGVDHGGGDIFVAQEFLHGANVVACFKQVGGEGVTKDVGGDAFGYVCALRGIPHCFLHHAGVEMMAAGDAGAGVLRKAGRGKDVLPAPFAVGVGVFAGQGVGQKDLSVTCGQVFVVQDAHLAQVFLQRGVEASGEDGGAIFGSFAITDDDLVLGKVDVLDA